MQHSPALRSPPSAERTHAVVAINQDASASRTNGECEVDAGDASENAAVVFVGGRTKRPRPGHALVVAFLLWSFTELCPHVFTTHPVIVAETGADQGPVSPLLFSQRSQQ